MNIKLVSLVAIAVLLGALWFAKSGKALFYPPMQDAALVCSRTECLNEFTAHIPINTKYPVKCPQCGENSAYPALSCPVCEQPYPFIKEHPLEKCPRCDAELPR